MSARYNTGVRIGNWYEDVKGAGSPTNILSADPRVKEFSTTTRNDFVPKNLDAAARAPVIPVSQSLPTHMFLGPGAHITPPAPSNQYLTTAKAQQMGISTKTVVAGKGEIPVSRSLAADKLISEDFANAPYIPMTVYATR